MNMGEKIYYLRTSKNMTLEELGNKVGVGKSTVRKWENGMIANMKRDKILKVSEALDTTPAFLMGWDEKEEEKPKAKVKGVKIPVLGRVAAGIPIEMIEDVLDYEEISEDMAKHGEYFALKIQGDSMTPRICNNDVVIVRQQNDAENGDIVIATINGDDAVCKRLQKYNDGIALISLNPQYDPIYLKKDEIDEKPVRIIGKVVELRGKF